MQFIRSEQLMTMVKMTDFLMALIFLSEKNGDLDEFINMKID